MLTAARHLLLLPGFQFRKGELTPLLETLRLVNTVNHSFQNSTWLRTTRLRGIHQGNLDRELSRSTPSIFLMCGFSFYGGGAQHAVVFDLRMVRTAKSQGDSLLLLRWIDIGTSVYSPSGLWLRVVFLVRKEIVRMRQFLAPELGIIVGEPQCARVRYS